MRARPGQPEMLVRIAADISRDDRQGVIPPELLVGIAVPVRVLWGTEDPLLPYSQAASLPRQFELRTAEGAGHMLAEEAPGEVVDAIRQTLG
jgi:pyruvate dehydrogenase E2 component (dihydrolipoamide acetyltransferase)